MFDVVDSNWGRGEDFILVQEEKGIGKWFVSRWCAWVGIFFKLILLETIYSIDLKRSPTFVKSFTCMQLAKLLNFQLRFYKSHFSIWS
jgi:hypothetical protein